jgi:hypothetical protein
MIWLFNFIEWFLNLFLRKKAEKIKQDAFLERQNELIKFAKVKEANQKYLSKYSGRKRYVKTPIE